MSSLPARPLEILFVAPYSPVPPQSGGASRVFNLIRVLARWHRITLLCFASAAEQAALGQLGELGVAVHSQEYPAGLRWKRTYQLRSLVGRSYAYYSRYSRTMAERLADLLARCHFDVIHFEASEMGYYAPQTGPIRVLGTQNVEYLLLEQASRRSGSLVRRLYNRLEARKVRADELASCRHVDAVLAVSDMDRAVLARHAPGIPVDVVPNGVDTTFFTPGRAPEQPGRIVFTGAIDYQPNTDGILYFAAEIWPRIRAAVPDATLAVVGKDPPARVRALAGDAIQVTGTVPDVRPWLETAAVVVVPLRVGSGTRLKILEALASGRAVVSTSLGCEGLEVTPGADILVADAPAEFAEAVVRCLQDPALRARLGARGRGLVERRYRWEAIGDSLSELYARLAARRAPVLGCGVR